MRTLTSFLFQFLFLSVSSASVFLFSNVVYPIKSVVERPPIQMPRMKLNFEEFSPAFAAMEDDYYISSYEEEKIPENIPAKALQPTATELIKSEAPAIQLPQMTMQTAQNTELGSGLAKLNTEPIQKTNSALNENKELSASGLPINAVNGIVPRHFWIQGKIELSEGLAISDPRDTLNVGWFMNGERKKEGRILLREGTYELKVDRLEGEMIAELADKRGFLIGEAIVDLDVLAKQRTGTGFIISGVDLKLRPNNASFKGQTVTVYDTPSNHQPVVRAQVGVGDHEMRFTTDEKGQFVEPVVSPQSTGMVIAQQDRFRQTVILANYERELAIHLFPDAFMEAFFNTIELPKKNRVDGVIWGVLRKSSQPAFGYQVQMTKHKATKPIYFQMYIANKGAQKTSEDGQFAFVGLNDGEYEVEVIDPLGRTIDSKLAVVRGGSVTELNFEVGDERNLNVRPFDPLSMDPKAVEFYAIGQGSVMNTQTEEILKLPSYPGQEPLLIYTKVQGADVEATTFASRNKKFQEVPVLNPSWWKGIQKAYNIKVEDGVIVGFVDTQESFEVYIDHQTEQTKILYIDQQGRTIPKSVGAKPAGYVIYGVEPGLHTLILESEQGQITSEAAYVDGESVAIQYKVL